jgi:hypothetical protein
MNQVGAVKKPKHGIGIADIDHKQHAGRYIMLHV